MNNNSAISNYTTLKVVLLGDTAVGKSCLMNRFITNQYEEYTAHTIGVDFLGKDVNKCGKRFHLQIWDTAGSERFRSLRTPFYRGCDICLLSFSLGDRFSFDNLNTWKKEFYRYANIDEGSPFPFILIANKCDLEERAVEIEEIRKWTDSNRHIPWIMTSAKTGKNVSEAFDLAVGYWIQIEETLEKSSLAHPPENIRLHASSDQRTGCCRSSL